MKMNKSDSKKSVDSKIEVQTYIDRLKYAIKSNSSSIQFQKKRRVDNDRERKYTNRYTIGNLFPDEDEVEVLKRELALLTVEEYIETVEDLRFPKRKPMCVFGKKYIEKDTYIKLRVELSNIEQANGNSLIYVMSFHFSEIDFKDIDFPYRKK